MGAIVDFRPPTTSLLMGWMRQCWYIWRTSGWLEAHSYVQLNVPEQLQTQVIEEVRRQINIKRDKPNE